MYFAFDLVFEDGKSRSLSEDSSCTDVSSVNVVHLLISTMVGYSNSWEAEAREISVIYMNLQNEGKKFYIYRIKQSY